MKAATMPTVTSKEMIMRIGGMASHLWLENMLVKWDGKWYIHYKKGHIYGWHYLPHAKQPFKKGTVVRREPK